MCLALVGDVLHRHIHSSIFDQNTYANQKSIKLSEALEYEREFAEELFESETDRNVKYKMLQKLKKGDYDFTEFIDK